jgi:hypothetical protein
VVTVARNGIGTLLGGLAAIAMSLGGIWGCATSTEFINEGPGQPSERAAGAVPDGELGVCRVPETKRPIIVDEKLWDSTRFCTARTPARFIRIGYGSERDPNAEADQEKMLAILKDGKKEQGGNTGLVNLFRALRTRGLKDPYLRDRVARETSRDGLCDYTYMLNTMAKQHEKVAKDKCTVKVYDPAARGLVCLFDTKREEVTWLTSSWSCVTHANALGEDTSCYRACSYDDWCIKHVTCAAPDIDLLLCAMGVCIPEPRAGL